jgi:hypothetical protein
MRLGHHKSPVRVCRFSKSHSKPFLAVGYDTGLIEVRMHFSTGSGALNINSLHASAIAGV